MLRFFFLLFLPLSLPALPLRFEFNQGQFSPSIVFASRAVALTASGPLFPHGTRMTLAGAHMRTPIAGPVTGHTAYFTKTWQGTAPQFAEARYRDVYPGIDLVFRDGAGKLEYDFTVAPGADPSAIRLRFPGARRIALDKGDLVVDGLRHHRPAVYQDVAGQRRYLGAAYRLRARVVTFDLGAYDRTLSLVIDPVITYATYAGGSGAETGNAIAADSAGNAYLAGNTDSSDFAPLKDAAAPRGYLAKLDPTGAKILASAVIGGASIDAIALDAAGAIVVTGSITAPAQFPGATAGAYQAGATAYLARITQDSTGFHLAFIATFAAVPSAVALDSTGAIYATGAAYADFQTTAGALQTSNGGGRCAAGTCSDAFVLKLSPDGSKAVYATFLGGNNVDTGRGIAVDSAGSAYLTGDTVSANFPTTPGAHQPKFGGRVAGDFADYGDAFVARLDAAGANLVYSTFFGGSAPDIAYGIAVDKAGNAFIAGGTQSANFPVTPGVFQPKYAGGQPVATPDPAGDAFVARFTAGGALAWSTFLGGAARDLAEAIALDSAGNVYVTGASESADFPLTAGAVRGCRAGGPWVSQLDPNVATLLASTSIGGMGFDEPHALAVNSAAAEFLAGDASSRAFFTSGAAAQPNFGGGDSDAFAVRLDLTADTRLSVACVLNAASFQPGKFSPFPLGTVAPGEIVSLFGIGLGPDSAAIAQPASGSYPTTLGGTRVLFDGVPATMLYAGAGQVNAIVPYGIKGSFTQMTVERGGITDGPRALPVAPAVPGIFTANSAGTQQAAVLNQDGSYNSPANPAPVGSVIVFYAVGAGILTPAMTDGSVAPGVLPLPVPQLPVTVQIRGAEAKVLYAGAAPGYVSGLLQINVEVPVVVGFGNSVPLTLQIGGQPSQFNVTIATR